MVDVCKNHEFLNVEGCRKQKVDPHHSDVETVVNASPSGLKRKPLDPLPMQALLRTIARIPLSEHGS